MPDITLHQISKSSQKEIIIFLVSMVILYKLNLILVIDDKNFNLSKEPFSFISGVNTYHKSNQNHIQKLNQILKQDLVVKWVTFNLGDGQFLKYPNFDPLQDAFGFKSEVENLVKKSAAAITLITGENQKMDLNKRSVIDKVAPSEFNEDFFYSQIESYQLLEQKKKISFKANVNGGFNNLYKSIYYINNRINIWFYNVYEYCKVQVVTQINIKWFDFEDSMSYDNINHYLTPEIQVWVDRDYLNILISILVMVLMQKQQIEC